MTIAAWPRFVEDAESDEDDDVCTCPLFTADGDESLPKRNLDALFASTPTLPKKRSMPNASVDGYESGGEPRPLSAGRSGPGGATAAELAWERTAQVRTCRFFLKDLPRDAPYSPRNAPGTHRAAHRNPPRLTSTHLTSSCDTIIHRAPPRWCSAARDIRHDPPDPTVHDVSGPAMASSRQSRLARSRPEAAASTIPIPSPNPTSRTSLFRTTRTSRAGGTTTKRSVSRGERRGTRKDARSRFRRASPRRCGRCGSTETPSRRRRRRRRGRFLFPPGGLPRRRASLGGTFGACEPRERRLARCSCQTSRLVGVDRTPPPRCASRAIRARRLFASRS